MPEISIKTAENGIPRTTVDDAITRGRRKVLEARSFREAQEAARMAQQHAVPASGMEQGDMLDPFNFTTVLKMTLERGEKDQHRVTDAKEPAQKPRKPAEIARQQKERTEKAETARAKEKEAGSREVKEVRTNEQGAVVEEKEAAEAGRKPAGKEAYAKRIVRTVIGNAPVQAAVLAQENEKDPHYKSSPADTIGRVFANMQLTDRTPEELRLNAGRQIDPGKAKKGGHDERSSDRAEGLERKEQPSRTVQAAPDTAYKPQEHSTEEKHNRPGQDKEAGKRATAQPERGIIRTEAVIMPADSISKSAESRQAREEESAKEPLTKDRGKAAEEPLKEAESGKNAMNSIITGARENAEAVNMVMQAAAIAHATGRELQFEKGRDLLQIKKEGKETFAFINGEKADIGKARDFMKDLTKNLGPELSGQLQRMVKTLSQSPALSMQQAAGLGKQPAVQHQARNTDAVTRD